MLGYCLTNFEITLKKEKENSLTFQDFYKLDNITINRNVLNKYLQDKIVYDDKNFTVVMEGYVLNKTRLMSESGKDYAQTILELYKTFGVQMANHLLGSFALTIVDKKAEKIVAFTDYIGEKPLFYFCESGKLAISGLYSWCVDAFKSTGAKMELDKQAVYYMLTYAFMGGAETYVKQIKRLLPGHFLVVDKNGMSTGKYWELRSDKYDLTNVSDNEIVDKLDELFREGLELALQKDKDYGYQSILELSGGMDSRTNAYMLKRLGAKPLCLCFSQSKDTDQTVSMAVAAHLEFSYVYKMLDDKNFLYSIDENIRATAGLDYCLGTAHSFDCDKTINMENKGLIIGGVLGHVGHGSFIPYVSKKYYFKKYIHKKPEKILFPYSYTLKDKVELSHLKQYPNEEIYLMVVRCMLGMLSADMAAQEFSESFTPFGYPRFIEYCMSIPIEKRTKTNIYRKWITEKMDNCGDYMYDGKPYKCKPNKVAMLFRFGTKKVKDIFEKALKIKPKIKITSKSQNPFDYWYSTDEALRKYYSDYVNSHISNPLLDEVRADINIMLKEQSLINRAQAMTVIGAVNMIWDNENIKE